MEKVFIAIIILVAGFFGIVAYINTTQNTPAPFLTSLTPAPSPIPVTPAPSERTTPPIPSPVPQSEWVTTATQASILTPKGAIRIQLYPSDAPKTVTNFATLANQGYYNSLTFHRVEKGFVVQGGDPNGNGTGGYSIYGPVFADELNPQTPSYQQGYTRGTVAMANRGPNTNGSQFFIMLEDNTSLPKQYTIFGKVYEGMEVVDTLTQGDVMTTVTVR
jgi:cyclophilin family peptidyl-prolyl cis-trans isomerase